MNEYYIGLQDGTALQHHGVLGMKWGVRRYQSYDTVPRGSGEGGKEIGAARVARKSGKIERKIEKKIAKNEAAREKTMAGREKHREKIKSKYDKKLSKIEADIKSFKPIREGLKDKKGRDILTKSDVDSMVGALNKKAEELRAKKKDKITDFDKGTKYFNKGYDTYSNILKNYRDAKISSFEDKAYKGSQEYKNAVGNYVNQVVSDMYYNKAGTVLGYTSDLINRSVNTNYRGRYLPENVLKEKYGNRRK